MPSKPSHLRMTAPDEKPAEPVVPLTIEQAAAADDQLALLIALRSRLATACQNEETPARDLAALSRRLVDVSQDIRTLRAQLQEEEGEPDGGDTEDAPWSAGAI
jgi:hypothetical protein